MTSNNETVSCQMPRGQHCENYGVKRETVHCYPWNVDCCCTWSEVAWCYRWNLGMFFKICFVLFCCITNHTMTGPLGNRKLCFLRISIFPSPSSREAWRFSGNKIHCSPRDQSLSVKMSSRLKCGPSYTCTYPELWCIYSWCSMLNWMKKKVFF